MTDTFAFDHAKEALGRRVISEVTDDTHAAEYVVISEKALIFAGRRAIAVGRRLFRGSTPVRLTR
ncbi:hypothetical protein IMW82_02760 [Rhodanobacter sp. B2A1Ga4]|nr:hypothetical protein [Rhodanobacter sp. B2A1Ga4]